MGFERRGIVLLPSDLEGMVETWVEWLVEAGLNLLGIHCDPDTAVAFVESEDGEMLLRLAERRAIDIEFEMHALRSLLPREEFERHPHWFRMNESRERVPDVNLCSANGNALDHVADRAVSYAKRLPTTTNRHYYWADDAQPWCACPDCANLSPSDQNVRVMNAIADALTAWESDAQLAYLAYWNTLEPPSQVEPSSALFLEYAPIKRNSALPLNDPTDPANTEHAATLLRLTRAFDMPRAHVLEYWMDVSRFSNWKRPGIELPFYGEAIAEDVAFYESLGFRSATSFGAWIDAEYIERFGKPPISEYGRLLRG
ncbi:MAG: DUF4838 domain-containing protein [Candidatus Poribacteria bacterium]|nr:DUF4838 domain-containing protein [Candidatus Poribacteria bacterium]